VFRHPLPAPRVNSAAARPGTGAASPESASAPQDRPRRADPHPPRVAQLPSAVGVSHAVLLTAPVAVATLSAIPRTPHEFRCA